MKLLQLTIATALALACSSLSPPFQNGTILSVPPPDQNNTLFPQGTGAGTGKVQNFYASCKSAPSVPVPPTGDQNVNVSCICHYISFDDRAGPLYDCSCRSPDIHPPPEPLPPPPPPGSAPASPIPSTQAPTFDISCESNPNESVPPTGEHAVQLACRCSPTFFSDMGGQQYGCSCHAPNVHPPPAPIPARVPPPDAPSP